MYYDETPRKRTTIVAALIVLGIALVLLSLQPQVKTWAYSPAAMMLTESEQTSNWIQQLLIGLQAQPNSVDLITFGFGGLLFVIGIVLVLSYTLIYPRHPHPHHP